MTEEASNILKDIMETKKITMNSIEGECRPVYRIDLPKDYIAYYVVQVNEKDYFIMSAGEKTCGDRKKEVPDSEFYGESPIKIIDNSAEKAGKKCHRYIVLGDIIEMICKDEDGNIVGNNFMEGITEEIESKHGSLDKFLAVHLDSMLGAWKERCDDYQEPTDDDDSMKHSAFQIEGLMPGGSKDITYASAVQSIYIKYVSMDPNETDEQKKDRLAILCSEIEGCTPEGDTGVIPPSMYPPDSIRFQLKISEKATIYAAFKVVVEYKDGKKDENHFELMESPDESDQMEFDEKQEL